MNFRVAFPISLVALSALVGAQEKAVKTERKTVIIEPAASKVNATPGPAATPGAAVKPDDKASPFTAGPGVASGKVPLPPAQIVHAFFSLVQQGDIEAAYSGLTRGSKIAERPEELRSLKTKTKEAIEVFGAVHGYDLVDSKPVGERLVRATYVSLGHEYPLRWRFYFYKSEATWRLIDLRVDDKLSGIFDETPEVRPADATP